MSEAVKEMAMKYYPKLWNLDKLKALVKAGKLTDEEYEEVVANANEN